MGNEGLLACPGAPTGPGAFAAVSTFPGKTPARASPRSSLMGQQWPTRSRRMGYPTFRYHAAEPAEGRGRRASGLASNPPFRTFETEATLVGPPRLRNWKKPVPIRHWSFRTSKPFLNGRRTSHLPSAILFPSDRFMAVGLGPFRKLGPYPGLLIGGKPLGAPRSVRKPASRSCSVSASH